MNIRTFVAILSQNPQYDFPKMRGGVKGRLELFRKFIHFGDAICANSTSPINIEINHTKEKDDIALLS